MAITKNFLIGALSTTAIALALVSPAKAEIVLSGDPNGWTFGFDGIINVFLNDTGASQVTGGQAGTTRQASTLGGNGNRFNVSDGLLPEVFGFNAHSPDFNGNKVNGRLSLEPSLGSGGYNSTGSSSSGVLEVREAWTSISGGWGELLAGKALGYFGSQAILNDITLFGVGAGAATASGGGNTTLGRIGYGYQYASWQPTVRYTTPAMNGFKASIGVNQANPTGYDSGTSSASATLNRTPKVEGGVTWAGKVSDATISAWAGGTWQDAEISGTTTYNGVTYNTVGKTIDSAGGEGGAKVSLGPVDFVGYGWAGTGLAVNGLQNLSSATDASGNGEQTYGFYVQGAYHFGQGTTVAASYGGNYADATSIQSAAKAVVGTLTEQSMFTGQIYHDINKAFRVVAEYDYQTANWNDGAAQHQYTGAVGFVALW